MDFLVSLRRAERGNVEEANKRIAAAQTLAQRVSDFSGGPSNQNALHIGLLRLAHRWPDITKAALICAYIGLGRRFQMASGECNQLVAVRSAQRSNHGDVIAARPIERVSVGVGIRPDAVNLLSEL